MSPKEAGKIWDKLHSKAEPEVDEERILQITNDVSEGDTNHLRKSELIEAVRYWSLKCSEDAAKSEQVKTQLALFVTKLLTS